MLNAPQVASYTDFNALSDLKKQAKDDTPAAIKEVAKQFESVFIGMMMKSMRQAKLAEGIFDSSQSDFYRDMYDKELSVHLAGKRGIGLADLIEKQLGPEQSVDRVKNQQIVDYQRRVRLRSAIKSNDISAVDMQQVAIKTTAKGSVTESVAIVVANPSITSAADFIKQLRPYAEKSAKQLGVDANILLSQAALETGWGKSVIRSNQGESSYNLFNIKADKSWHGSQTNVSTLEFKDGIAKKEMAGFRSYTSYQESFDDYVHFIKNNPRYGQAIKTVDKPEQYIRELQQAGYATDPNYANKVINIYHSKLLITQGSESLVMQRPQNPGSS